MRGSSISAVRFEQSAHHGSVWCVSAGQRVCVVRGGVEPPTFRFSGAIERSRHVASRSLIRRLAALTVGRGRLASPGACLRWLPFWLPGSGSPAPSGYKGVSRRIVSR